MTRVARGDLFFRMGLCWSVVFLLIGIVLCTTPCAVFAADKKKRENNAAALLTDIVKGNSYLGGKYPGIYRVDARGKFGYDYQKRKYYRLIKVFVRRSGGDEGGRQMLYNTRTYGTALKQLTGWKPNLRTEWAMRLGVFGYSKKFSPIMLDYFYLTALRQPNGSLVAFNVGPKRRAKGKKLFVEDLPWHLAPGEYQIGLSSEVSLADHPIKGLMAIWDWFEFVDKVVGVKLPKMLDITKDVLKFVIVNRLTRSEARYRLVVQAEVPKLIGLEVWRARSELEKWNLRLVPANTTKCHVRQFGKIVKQGSSPGRLQDPRKPVAVKVCARRPAATPAPVVTGKYVVFGVDAGPNLYIGTEESLKTRTNVSFANGGLSSSRVTYKALSPTYSNLAAAQQDFCKGVAKKITWGMAAPCRELFYFRNGVRYAGCESSVRAAIAQFCPKFAQSGTVWGTIVK